ncbi:DNA-3-methyladenine glycosylase I [Nocardioides mangrovi]|uniref:DNA-3-methyladenine glycosylase I n=1 Tax=Nocardioides mangrovi TaxID=2874580 RepID=A0ABS7UDP9_9ACTN|nr:DNA-3-methyladenine glycosylase I [Nocardioides mangrovi]MBZ5739012.1 DNA-3-methyladenine glycosylase I [Nocardioides mangrovi]
MVGRGIDPDTPLTVTLADGRPRCHWAGAPIAGLVDYHDVGWGTPVHDEAGLLRALTEALMAGGLSWEVVFRRRDAMRDAFAGYEPTVVAAYDERDVQRLLADRRVVRQRRKIEQVIHNARLVVEGPSLDELVWAHAPVARGPVTSWASALDSAPVGDRVSAVLRTRGYRGVGPVVAHSMLNAVGVLDGHVLGCFRTVSSRA